MSSCYLSNTIVVLSFTQIQGRTSGRPPPFSWMGPVFTFQIGSSQLHKHCFSASLFPSTASIVTELLCKPGKRKMNWTLSLPPRRFWDVSTQTMVRARLKYNERHEVTYSTFRESKGLFFWLPGKVHLMRVLKKEINVFVPNFLGTWAMSCMVLFLCVVVCASVFTCVGMHKCLKVSPL